ncbi:hypothetical protein PCARR_a2972 [Pseudoalteromonas carrageenovora IAM 12662]|uniref:Uncharacterized protein n=1 Tax=Pseudoalteromonas carrageenovora IAM 12662 TaxID=1314868 RepID=A0ABR9EKZ6_PSEVC|nr:hypothetical protein [Pseudoalteromonas carrageenovora IAM 12662]
MRIPYINFNYKKAALTAALTAAFTMHYLYLVQVYYIIML